jgi:hypothetical protein
MGLPKKYKCPVCQKPLTKREFERAFKIHEAQQQHVEARERQLAQAKRDFEEQKKDITKQLREKERARTRRIVGNKERKIIELRETVKLLKRGKTPQEYGPDFEKKLVKRLRAVFVGDDVRHEGKAGDVFHIVKDGGKIAGSIIYECKWTPRISGSHVQQAAKARMSRHAEFAVLVCSGTKRGFNGLDEMYGVLIVAPAGVLALAGLLRNHLVEMFRAGIEKKQRAKIAGQLLRFIKAPEFRNHIEDVVRSAERLKVGVEEECKWHINDWKKRLTAYDRIGWDGWAIQENIRRVLRGEVPKRLVQPKQTLALPAPSGELILAKAHAAKAGQ